jgi:hypothetical protein
VRIFLDANILFSAAKTNGAVRRLLDRPLAAGHECWADDYVIAEARRNLGSKGPEALSAFEAMLPGLRIAQGQALERWPETLAWLPEKDRPVLAAAMRLKCQALVTGDRTHFGAGFGKIFSGVTLHSPRSLAEALLD